MIVRETRQLFSDGNYVVLQHIEDGSLNLMIESPTGEILQQMNLDNAVAIHLFKQIGRFIEDYG